MTEDLIDPTLPRRMIQPEISTIEIPHGYRGKLTFKGGSALYTLDFETGEQRIYRGAPQMRNPAWHPNGRWIACGKHHLYLIKTDTSEIVNLSQKTLTGGDPAWSPDATKLVYFVNNNFPADQWGLYVLDVARNKASFIPAAQYSSQAVWSPDGTHIAFAKQVKVDKPNYQVFTLNMQCHAVPDCPAIQITRGDFLNYSPAWSPDGQQIAFVSERDGYFAVYVMNADGTNLRRLTQHKDGDFDPCWSPDGQYIVFSRRFRRKVPIKYHLHIMRADGTEVTLIPTSGGIEPDWWMG